MIRVAADVEALRQDAAEEIARIAAGAVERHGGCSIALAGGSTPRGVYALLADPDAPFRRRIPWRRVRVFWGDERQVPPDHPDSNYRMADEALLSRVGIPAANVHRIHGEESDAAAAADAYEREIREIFHLSPSGWPRFDLVLLGMGADGHTASIFPGTAAVSEAERLVMSVPVAELDTTRITMTPPLINHAANVLFLVSGAGKAATVREVLEGDAPPNRYPARAIHPTDGRLQWLLDRNAAARLRS